MLGLTLGMSGCAAGMSALPMGVLFWHLPNPVLVLVLLGCSFCSGLWTAAHQLVLFPLGNLAGNLLTAVEKSLLAWEAKGFIVFFLPWFCFRLKGKDLGISHKFGMELCGMGCSQGRPSAGVGEGSRLETGI